MTEIDYLDKINQIEELTKIISGNIQLDKTLDLIYKKCQELRKLLDDYYID